MAFSGLSLRNIGFLGAATQKAILLWLLNEGAGTTVNDSSGNGYIGTTNASWSTSNPPENASSYLTFSGTSQELHSNGNVAFKSDIITLDFWTRSFNWAQSGRYLFSTTTSGGFTIAVTASKIVCQVYDINGLASVYNVPIPVDANFHHFQIVLNNRNGTIQAYMDSGGNVAAFSSSIWVTPTTFPSNTPLYVASLVGVTGFFIGSLALIKVYSGDTHFL